MSDNNDDSNDIDRRFADLKDAQKKLADMFGVDVAKELEAVANDLLSRVQPSNTPTEKPLPNGLRAKHGGVHAASMALASLLPRDELPSIDLTLTGEIENGEPIFLVSAKKLTEEQVAIARERLKRHNTLLGAAGVMESVAKKLLTDDLDDPRTDAEKKSDEDIVRAFENGTLPRASKAERKRAMAEALKKKQARKKAKG